MRSRHRDKWMNVPRSILKVLHSRRTMSPKEIAIELDQYPQIRNTMVHLRGLGLISRVGYAKYQITEWGIEFSKTFGSEDRNS